MVKKAGPEVKQVEFESDAFAQACMDAVEALCDKGEDMAHVLFEDPADGEHDGAVVVVRGKEATRAFTKVMEAAMKITGAEFEVMGEEEYL